MNIFLLDNDPNLSAKYHCDKHVVKMSLEYSQIICTAVRSLNIPAYSRDLPYKSTHEKHPCVLWAKETIENLEYLIYLALCTWKEYRYRYRKTHKCWTALEDTDFVRTKFISFSCRSKPNYAIYEDLVFGKNHESFGMTMPALAMPDEYKVKNNPVDSYRNYYVQEKEHLHSWTKRDKPPFIL